MVKLFYPSRYSRQKVPTEMAEKAIKVFDGTQVLSKAKVIHSVPIYLNQESKLYNLNMEH
jgi:hypothetical protein